jgi:anaerobic selenocysteine-containing dehydrogenase
MHPDDAAIRGIADCQPVRIRSHRGQIETPVRLTTEMMPGVVSLPHGWGHGRAGLRLRLASARGGASMNDLTDERCYDAITGTAQLSGIPVSVDPAIPAGS